MQHPLVSIIIPVGPAHHTHARLALASCRWQTVPSWEAILINDAPTPLAGIPHSGRVHVIETGGGQRSAAARNLGIAQARGAFTVFLDADDYLLPQALERLLRGHCDHEQSYSYSDHYALLRNGHYTRNRPPEYDRAKLLHFNLHPITALVPTALVREVGGFDEHARGWEDWTIWLRLAHAGYCGERVRGPVFVYRYEEGTNHHIDNAGGDALRLEVVQPYRDRGPMMGCNCGGAAAAARDIAREAVTLLGGERMSDTDAVILEYIGPGDGTQSFRGPSGTIYRAGRHPAVRFINATDMPITDAAHLVGLGIFRRVAPEPAFVPPPVDEMTPDDAPPVHVGVAVGDDEALELDGEVARPRRGRQPRT